MVIFRNRVFALLVAYAFLTIAFSTNSYAAIITTISSVPLFSGSDTTDIATHVIQTTSVNGLQQFDPSLGVLNTVRFTIEGSYEASGVSLRPYRTDIGSFHSADIGFQVSLTTPDPSSYLGVDFFATQHASQPLSGPDDIVNFQQTDFNTSYTIGGLLDDYIGTGNIDFLNLGFYSTYGIQNTQVLVDAGIVLDYVNAGAKFESYSVGPTNVTLEYSYTGVPIPASIWLFISGLIALIGASSKRKQLFTQKLSN